MAAINPAACSCLVRMSLILERERESRKSRFSSPGIPKIYSTPSSSRHWIMRSEAFIVVLGVFYFWFIPEKNNRVRRLGAIRTSVLKERII